MRAAIKATKTFSLDRDILATVKRTKGSTSESEPVGLVQPSDSVGVPSVMSSM